MRVCVVGVVGGRAGVRVRACVCVCVFSSQVTFLSCIFINLIINCLF